VDESDKSLLEPKKRGSPYGNQRACGNKGGGRKPKYQAAMAGIARKACGRGMTGREIADLLNISESTIHRWKLQYPQFSRAWSLGKAEADARVERALFERAVGYSFQAEKVVITRHGPRVVRWREHLPPDTAAALAYLRNRRPDRWRDTRHIEHGAAPYREIEETKELRALLQKQAQQLGLIPLPMETALPEPPVQKATNGPT
jgi:hypothetical protein